MFADARLIGSPRDDGIVVQTSLGSYVPNDQAVEPAPRHRTLHQKLKSDHAFWAERKPPVGIYNCFGHVWASRRTAIRDDSHVDMILEDDRYRVLTGGDSVLPGDVALYVASGPRSYLHVGRVVEVRAVDGLTTTIPWVLSKFGDSFGEFLHASLDVPWRIEDYGLEFWTDRP